MLYTKEFYEIMEVFESNAKKHIRFGEMGLSKEPKDLWVNQQYYCDGNVNSSFKMFLAGVSLGKIIQND